PPGLDYVAAFLGCLYAGVIAVPAYPPDPARLDQTLPRLQAIVAAARPAVALTTPAILTMATMLAAHAPDFGAVRWLATDDAADAADGGRAPQLRGESQALLHDPPAATAA